MRHIDFLFLSLAPAGGWCTNAAMFTRGAQALGATVRLHRLGKKSHSDLRPFGMGASYLLTSEEDMAKLPGPVVLCATDPHHYDIALRLLRARSDFYVIVHDPNELRNEAYAREVRRHRVIVHRERMTHYFTKRDLLSPSTVVHYVPFCYIPDTSQKEWTAWKDRKLAVCLSRIDFDKNIEMQLEANRLLDKEKIQFYGFENRAYALRSLMPKYPEWVQSNGLAYKKTDDSAAVKRAQQFRAVVDTSGGSGGDGGGAQYTYFESAAAGCVLILNSKWTNVTPREMVPGENCLAVDNAAHLAETLKMIQGWKDGNETLKRLREGNTTLLKNHSLKKVIPTLFKALQL